MKRNFFSAALLLILGQTVISCNSCEDRNNDPIPTQTPEVSAGTPSSDDAANSFDDGTATAFDDATAGTQNSANTEKRTATTVQSSKSASVKTSTSNATSKAAKSGYSAPNGTDAENHDGDPYTKHDTTSMPTGTSIR